MDIYSLAYQGEEDLRYGVAGMALLLYVWDRRDLIRSIDIDSADPVQFAPQFFVCTNPAMSAKTVWSHMVDHLQMLTGLALSNAMCRSMAQRRRSLDTRLRDMIFSLADAQGRETCALEPDETQTLCNKVYRYVCSLYDNPQVNYAAHAFADRLAQRRTLSGTEAMEEMHRCLHP